MFLDWGSITSFYGQLLRGAGLTLVITGLAFAIAVVVGMLVCAGRISRVTPIRWASTVYVEVMRNTPVLLQIFIIFYGLPSLGLRFSAVTAGILGLGLNVGAYLAEIFRAGVLAVPKGHLEAAAALALSKAQTLIWIVTPVSLRAIFPALSNMFLATLLGSSLLSVIAVPELTGETNEISSRTFLTIEVYSFSTVIYLVLTVGCSLGLALLARWLFPRGSRS